MTSLGAYGFLGGDLWILTQGPDPQKSLATQYQLTELGRQASGALAEAWVAMAYEAAGYQIIDRNWSCRAGEIDLICCREGAYTLVEVRYRQHEPVMVTALFDGRKHRRCRAAASQWCRLQNRDLAAAEVVLVTPASPRRGYRLARWDWLTGDRLGWDLGPRCTLSSKALVS